MSTDQHNASQRRRQRLRLHQAETDTGGPAPLRAVPSSSDAPVDDPRREQLAAASALLGLEVVRARQRGRTRGQSWFDLFVVDRQGVVRQLTVRTERLCAQHLCWSLAVSGGRLPACTWDPPQRRELANALLAAAEQVGQLKAVAT